jgi:hypothetical protein
MVEGFMMCGNPENHNSQSRSCNPKSERGDACEWAKLNNLV